MPCTSAACPSNPSLSCPPEEDYQFILLVDRILNCIVPEDKGLDSIIHIECFMCNVYSWATVYETYFKFLLKFSKLLWAISLEIKKRAELRNLRQNQQVSYLKASGLRLPMFLELLLPILSSVYLGTQSTLGFQPSRKLVVLARPRDLVKTFFRIIVRVKFYSIKIAKDCIHTTFSMVNSNLRIKKIPLHIKVKYRDNQFWLFLYILYSV